MSDTVPFNTLTIPTPEPYEKKKSDQQRENFYYVLNQLLLHAAAAGWELPDPADLLQALQDLQFENLECDFGFVKVNISGYVQDVT